MNAQQLMQEKNKNEQEAIQNLIGSSNKILQIYANIIKTKNQKLDDEMEKMILENMSMLDNMIQTGFFMETSMDDEKTEELEIKRNFISVFTDTVEQNGKLVNHLTK